MTSRKPPPPLTLTEMAAHFLLSLSLQEYIPGGYELDTYHLYGNYIKEKESVK